MAGWQGMWRGSGTGSWVLGLPRRSRGGGGGFDAEELEAGGVGEPALGLGPVHDERLGERHDLAAGRGVLVAALELFGQLHRLGRHVVGLGDEEARRARREQVVEEGGRPVDCVAVARLEQLAHGHDPRAFGGLDRTLRGGVVAADGLDRVADELEPHRVRLARREEVHDAAAHAELAVRVHRVLAREAGVAQQVAERGRRQLVAGAERGRGGEQAGRRAHARQQARDGHHDEARRAGRQRVQGARARGGHLEVGREAAVGVDLERGAGENGALGVGFREALERREEEARVADGPLDVCAGGDDEHGGRLGDRRGDQQGLRRGRQARHPSRRRREAGPGRRRLEERP